MRIRVSIVEDDQPTRDSLSTLVAEAAETALASAHPSAEDALRLLPRAAPDVAIVDINLPAASGIICTARLKHLMPRLGVLILTTYEERDLIFDSLRAGASGYLLKKVAAKELIPAIVQVQAGGAPMSMQVARKVVDFFRRSPAPDVGRLSPREHEILELLAKGYRYKEIMARLDLSLSTVRTHVGHIYEKLHVQSRTEATAKYLQGI